MSSADFSALPPEYQHLLHLAGEQHRLDIVPLRALAGGQTGAFLYLVSVSAGDLRRIDHLILKLDRVNERTRQTETERHRLALSQAPPMFAGEHMARLVYEVQHEGTIALFYSVAGQSLQRFRPLASQERQSRLETLFAATNDFLLREWNAGATFRRALHPRELLRTWLGYRLGPGGRIASLLRDTFHIAPDTEGFLIQGEVFPNPLSFGLSAARWQGARPIDAVVGYQHGDLNIGNILAEFAEGASSLEGYFLIDFALYKAEMPLLFDPRYLEMSYLTRELDRAPFDKWVSLVGHYASRDVPDPREVPVELAGACAAINAGRASFQRWVCDAHPSLSDDLRGQFWLAAVAAGLNFCNKAGLPPHARLAGLIYGAAHLKRYCNQFGISPPVDVRLLYEAGRWGGKKAIDLETPSTGGRGTRLPVPPTTFVGRETDVKSVKARLTDEKVRLLTLTGPGGTGKTRLALEAATGTIELFDDGAFFVDLAPVLEADLVLAAVARALGVREASDRPLLDELRERLRERRTLLLLDNFEQVTPAAPRLGELLRDCSGLKLLVTSREALHVGGEHVFPVPPLAMPGSDLKRLSVEQLGRFDAIRLFAERAGAANLDFELTDANAEVVSEICARLDGLPLAIELAAARLSLFTPEGLLERLRSRLKLLKGGARDLPARQQTLRDTIDWSYELLDNGEQRLFRVLSVFLGCTVEAAERVAGEIGRSDGTEGDVLDDLASLVDKSLVRRVDHGAGESRLLMLETIREYAAERLREDPELDAAAQLAHATYFANFARRQWERLAGYEGEAALGELEAELDNLQSAWRYWATKGDFEQLHGLTDCLWLLYDARGWYRAAADLTSELLNLLASTPSTPERAEQEITLQTSLARALLAIRGYTSEVEQAYARAFELCRGRGEVPQLYPVLRGLTSFYVYRGEFEKGAGMGEQILSLAERLDDTGMRADGHLVVGYCLSFLTSLKEGLDHLEQGIACCETDQDRSRRFRFGNNVGVACRGTSALVLWMLGFPDRARQRADEAVALAKSVNHPFSMAYALFHSGLLHLWRREPELVGERARAVLEVADEHEFEIWTAVGTCLRGAALAGSGRADEGLGLIQAGMAQYQGVKTRPPVFWPLLLFIQGVVCAQAGKPAEGLTVLDGAMATAGRRYGSGLSSDLCRLKGELLLALSPENAAGAEEWFRQALEAAREGEATMLELRAATSLHRLWRGRGRVEEGRRLLGEVYDRMTEGFGTPDLEDARALLDA